ncbi:MAG: C40 family peptidase [Syntrophomonadaceae bacterium]|nr:C40 family peptidase [Syntrophomonadaceae bacterium]
MQKRTMVKLTPVLLSVVLIFLMAVPLGAVTITINGGQKVTATGSGQPVVTFPDGTTMSIPRFVDSAPAQNSLPAEPAQAKKAPAETQPVKAQPAKAVLSAQTPVSDSSVMAAFRAGFDNSPAKALVARAIWYMKYGYMVYGHTKYPTTGYIDCSNFVSLVYKDFGYSITSAARKYNTVGQAVSGVYSKKQTGSTKKYTLVGVDKLKPGDIMTFWKVDSSGNRYIGHVAIYMGKLNNKPAIIHTCQDNPTAIGITTSFTYWYGEHFAGARRVLPSSAYGAGNSYKDLGPVIPAKYRMTAGPVIMPKDLAQGF